MELLNLDINNEELNIDMLIDEDDETNSINDNNNIDIDFPQYYNVSKKRKKKITK